MYQINMLHTLNLHNIIHQFYFNKARKRNKILKQFDVTYETLLILAPTYPKLCAMYLNATLIYNSLNMTPNFPYGSLSLDSLSTH